MSDLTVPLSDESTPRAARAERTAAALPTASTDRGTSDSTRAPGSALDDGTGPGLRQAGRLQAAVLVGASCLSVLGATLIAPVQPAIRDAFAGQAGVEVLVPISLTVPALMIGLMAPFAGRVVDSVGRLRLLTLALVVYALVGTAPLYLDSLPLIVASRVGVGIAEAAIMTCATTLIADLWSGSRRNKILGLQAAVTSLSAVVFIGAGGALGASSWRTPFALYAVSLVFAVLVPLTLWQPAAVRRVQSALPPVNWTALRPALLITFFGGIVFYAPIVELSFVLDGIGVSSVATIGGISAFAALATAIGALSFSRVAGRGPSALLPVALTAAGCGLLVMGAGSAAGSVPLVAAGAVLCSVGTGLLLPTLLTWAQHSLTAETRGRGTGMWTAAFFIGQFICPLAILALAALLGGLSAALMAVGVGALVLAGVGRTLSR